MHLVKYYITIRKNNIIIHSQEINLAIYEFEIHGITYFMYMTDVCMHDLNNEGFESLSGTTLYKINTNGRIHTTYSYVA